MDDQNFSGHLANAVASCDTSTIQDYLSTGYTGGGLSHNNMQPYTVANYIIKAKDTILSYAQIQTMDPQGLWFDTMYPVGSYFETSDSTFNPNSQWTGTWTSETITDDYLVEEGTSGIWTYRKWASGIAECWGNNPVYIDTAAQWSAFDYYYTQVTNPNYPTNLFIQSPTVSILADKNMDNPLGPSAINTMITTATASDPAGNIKPSNVRVWRPDNSVSSNPLNCVISIRAKGLWKTYSAPTTKYKWHRVL